ncbi:cell surface glycoprotein CD200 receptor 1-B-like isoform X2 [Numida meleagris]|uniref:cell surface glycoprotein CD200 receptor 1-B-like isoform X2 n=1 Tax=Numida meleagris TaxID=8996 RepID=UPI000B3DDC5C|nr:cell surface glycoprotein CD200 receptor 1-B-like isoform X2 [Numida meleagris]
MGISQQAGWCKKPVSPMNTRAALEVVRNTPRTIVLLTIAAVTGSTGNNRVSADLGHSTVMICPNTTSISMVTWKISTKTGGLCTLAYRFDQKKTDRTNCSDRMNWRSRPDWDRALKIQQVGMADEGNYTCEVVNADGNFHSHYHLTVLASPRTNLYCDDHGNPVCEAETVQPAAEISWVPESNSTPRADNHDNGTVTVLSRFAASSTNGKNPTCIVSHTTLNETKSITCSPVHIAWFLHCVISLACLLASFFLLAVLRLCIFRNARYVQDVTHKTQNPSGHS